MRASCARKAASKAKQENPKLSNFKINITVSGIKRFRAALKTTTIYLSIQSFACRSGRNLHDTCTSEILFRIR